MLKARAEVEKAFEGFKLKRLPGITPDMRSLVSTGMLLHGVNEHSNIVLTFERPLLREGAKIIRDLEQTLAQIAKSRRVKIALLKKAPEGKERTYATPDAGEPGSESVSHYVPSTGNYRFAVLIWKNSR